MKYKKITFSVQTGYWGLGTDPQGCQPCNCDVGGAYDVNCDQRSGQCRCRPNVIGQKCDQVRPGYFYATLDWQRYEGEFARGTGVSRAPLNLIFVLNLCLEEGH